MDKHVRKSNEYTFSTTGTTSASPHFLDTADNQVNYMNLNFNDNSDSSSQPKDFPMEHHKIINTLVQSNVSKPGPSKILPPPFPLGIAKDSSSKTDSDSLPKEKSLFEMGFNANDAEGWKNVQPPKENLYKLLKDMIDKHAKPNVQIRIGDITFNCHMMVLQCYSDFFMEFNNEILIQLPEEKVTPGAFMMVYDWMLAEEPLVQREGILELFNAANFLRIQELIKQCWFCLGDDECFREDTAFLLYLEARKYGLEVLEQLMLMRVCKFFLTLVASKEYLDLSAKEICTLLSSNTIGVNSEIEILMSAVRWLSHNWEERQQHLLDVLRCVRFTLMPSWFLVTLTKNANSNELDRIVSHPEVNKMINDGISYVASQMHYGHNRDEFLQFLDRLQLVSPTQRQWIYDKQCAYHHCLASPNMEYTTYKSFLDYLEHIRKVGKDYWRSIELVKDVGGKSLPCAIHSDCRKSVDQALIQTSSQNSCDHSMQCGENKERAKSKENNVSKKPNSPHPRSNKRLLRRSPWERPKPMVSSTTSQCVSLTVVTDTEAEIETAVNFKCPQDIDEEFTLPQTIQQADSILNDTNEHHNKTDLKIQRKHIVTLQPVLPIDSSPVRRGDRDPNKRHQQPKQQLQIPLPKSHHQPIKQQTNHISDSVIYKNDNGKNTTAAITSFSAPISIPDSKIQGVADKNVDSLAALGSVHLNKNNTTLERRNDEKKAESIVVSKKPVDGHDSHKWNSQQSFVTASEHKWTLKRKIIVFGGIDPYCLHCQQHELQHQQQQQRKHVFSQLPSNTMCSHTQPLQAMENGNGSTNTGSNMRVNNKFKNFGDEVLIYDNLDAMEWRHLTHIPFGSRHHHAVAVCNGLIYLVGGTRTALGCAKKSVFEKSVWCFDPLTLKWTLDSSLPESRRDFAIVPVEKKTCNRCKGSTELHEHETGFYVLGGEGTHGVALSTVWFYGVKRKIWIKMPPLKMGRYGLAAAMVNNEIWVAGGIVNGPDIDVGHEAERGNATGCTNNATFASKVHAIKSNSGHVITDTMEIYTLKCSHEPLEPNIKVAAKGSCNIENGTFGNTYAAGDSNALNERNGRAFEELGASCSDCVLGKWIISEHHLRVPRVFGKFCKMTNGDLFLVGGIGPGGEGELTSLSDIDHFQVEEQKWEYYGALSLPRHGHDVGELNDHCFAVIGGVSTVVKSTLMQTEVYCTEVRKCLNHLLPDLPRPVSGSSVASMLK